MIAMVRRLVKWLVGKTPSSAFWGRRECGIGHVVYIMEGSWK
jgi:hypothetical protein